MTTKQEFKVSLRHNIGKACDADSTRFALGGVAINQAGNVAIGCDGRILVAAPIEIQTADGEKLEGEPLLAGNACTGATSRKPLDIVSLPASQLRAARCEAKGKIHDTPDGRYPNWRQVLPKMDRSNAEYATVTLCPKNLKRLLDCMQEPGSDEAITFIFPANKYDPEGNNKTQGIVQGAVSAFSRESGAIGVIMPMVGDEDLQTSLDRFESQANSFATAEPEPASEPVEAEPEPVEAEPEPVEAEPASEPEVVCENCSKPSFGRYCEDCEPEAETVVEAEPEPVAIDASAFLAALNA